MFSNFSVMSIHYICNQKKMSTLCHLLKIQIQILPSSTQLRTPRNSAAWCPQSRTGALATQLLKRPTHSVLLRTQDWPRGSWAERPFEGHLPYKAMHVVWFHAPDPLLPKKVLPDLLCAASWNGLSCVGSLLQPEGFACCRMWWWSALAFPGGSQGLPAEGDPGRPGHNWACLNLHWVTPRLCFVAFSWVNNR